MSTSFRLQYSPRCQLIAGSAFGGKVTISGLVDTSNPICCSVPQGISVPGPQPKPEVVVSSTTDLVAVVPNPFNPTTTIRFSVAKPGSRVLIAIYDVTGRMVKRLVDEQKAPGEHEVGWDGLNDKGEDVATAVYFVKLSSGDVTKSMKLVLLK